MKSEYGYVDSFGATRKVKIVNLPEDHQFVWTDGYPGLIVVKKSEIFNIHEEEDTNDRGAEVTQVSG